MGRVTLDRPDRLHTFDDDVMGKALWPPLLTDDSVRCVILGGRCMHPGTPFGEVVRMTLLGNHEQLSAERAREVGLVSEVVADGEAMH
ncbi:MAG: hypothetical protein WKF43_12255, partial [Acidimicrobiales bacterium]